MRNEPETEPLSELDVIPSWLEPSGVPLRWPKQPSHPEIVPGTGLLLWRKVDLRFNPGDAVFFESTKGPRPTSELVAIDLLNVPGENVAPKRRVITPPRDLLWRFLALRDADDTAVLAFASRWGPLPWCLEHEQPATHSGMCYSELTAGSLDRYHEPIAAYREISRWFSLIVDTAEKLAFDDRNKTIRRNLTELWAIIVKSPKLIEKIQGMSADSFGPKAELQYLVNSWLIPTFGFRPSITWQESDQFAALGFSRGSACLATTLARRVIGRLVSPMHRCHACNAPYPQNDRIRAPKAGARNYCSECRENGNAKRASDRESARKQRAQKRADAIRESRPRRK